ncbi:GNAT family N-acetyltransferase [Sporosarcina beigongshangi]|uniref:GNAT family N-acetyltransferase n=1 Tax=Sporosarcina beigongshangi TaxID=2782538 RepID=UPI001939575E|nr:GNAT family protein [Sporosarcina beigongshangi]
MDKQQSKNRVQLRELVKDDWPSVHRYASMEIVSRYQPWGPNTKEETLLFLEAVQEDAKKKPRSRFVFAVFEKNTAVMIGSGEINIRDIVNREGEIGYIFHPDYWGQGYATEVAHLLINFGFQELNLHRIYATCDPRNSASVKVLEKVGMVKEGCLRENLLNKDSWRDSFLYGILEHEWNA